MGNLCWTGNLWAGELYLKAERSAKAGSVSCGGRCLGVISPQPERITRVQDDLQQSQPGHGHNSILPLHPGLQQPNGDLTGTRATLSQYVVYSSPGTLPWCLVTHGTCG